MSAKRGAGLGPALLGTWAYILGLLLGFSAVLRSSPLSGAFSDTGALGCGCFNLDGTEGGDQGSGRRDRVHVIGKEREAVLVL